MRPLIDDAAITLLRGELPEFEDNYRDLVEIYDEDLTPEIILMELADFVASLVSSGGSEGILERCLMAVDGVAAGTDDGPDLVAHSFLNELPIGIRAAVAPYFGPFAADLAERLFSGESIEEVSL